MDWFEAAFENDGGFGVAKAPVRRDWASASRSPINLNKSSAGRSHRVYLHNCNLLETIFGMHGTLRTYCFPISMNEIAFGPKEFCIIVIGSKSNGHYWLGQFIRLLAERYFAMLYSEITFDIYTEAMRQSICMKFKCNIRVRCREKLVSFYLTMLSECWQTFCISSFRRFSFNAVLEALLNLIFYHWKIWAPTPQKRMVQ